MPTDPMTTPAQRKLIETLAYVLPGLRALVRMCSHAGLALGEEKAAEMVCVARDALKKHAPYSEFCTQPEKCALAGRCTREIVCND